MVTRGWGQGENGELELNGDRVSVWPMKKIGRWMVVMGHNIKNALYATELYTSERFSW